eukprot:scaffold1098_cov417-Prasinococcus_capsulatus_cf.AAC.15
MQTLGYDELSQRSFPPYYSQVLTFRSLRIRVPASWPGYARQCASVAYLRHPSKQASGRWPASRRSDAVRRARAPKKAAVENYQAQRPHTSARTKVEATNTSTCQGFGFLLSSTSSILVPHTSAAQPV